MFPAWPIAWPRSHRLHGPKPRLTIRCSAAPGCAQRNSPGAWRTCAADRLSASCPERMEQEDEDAANAPASRAITGLPPSGENLPLQPVRPWRLGRQNRNLKDPRIGGSPGRLAINPDLPENLPQHAASSHGLLVRHVPQTTRCAMPCTAFCAGGARAAGSGKRGQGNLAGRCGKRIIHTRMGIKRR